MALPLQLLICFPPKGNTKHNNHRTQQTQNTKHNKHNKHKTQQTQNTTNTKHKKHKIQTQAAPATAALLYRIEKSEVGRQAKRENEANAKWRIKIGKGHPSMVGSMVGGERKSLIRLQQRVSLYRLILLSPFKRLCSPPMFHQCSTNVSPIMFYQ